MVEGVSIRRLIAAFCGVWVVSFGTAWLVLEPLGGFDAISVLREHKGIAYLCLFMGSTVIALATALIRELAAIQAALIKLSETQSGAWGFMKTSLSYNKLLREAAREVVISGLSLPFFATEVAMSEYENLLAKGVRITLIVVNPFSPALALRPGDLYEVIDHVQEASANTIIKLQKFMKSKVSEAQRKSFRLGVTNVSPGISVMRIDEKIWWGPYLLSRTGAKGPYTEVGTGNVELWRVLEEHVNKLVEHTRFIGSEENIADLLPSLVAHEALVKASTVRAAQIQKTLTKGHAR
jgi:hypothetical protein